MIPEAPWARVFEAVIDTPNDVEKVRQLVLGRAMRGLLISQVESEGTGAEVLRRLAPLCTGQTAPNESGARWHEVPSSWEWSTLGMVGKIVGGGTPKTDNPEFFSSDGFPWLTPADLNGFRGKQITLGRKRISRAGLANSSAQLLPPGTVLFSSRAPIGYVAIAGCELTTNQGFKSVVPYLPEMAEFLYYYLKSAAVRIDREASGTTFKEVSGRIVSQIPVPLPPLAEQKRIVAKVDELMALCDRLEAQLQERDARSADLAKAALAKFSEEPTVENLEYLFHPRFSVSAEDVRTCILMLAMQGRLEQQIRSDEPVEIALARNDENRRQRSLSDRRADKQSQALLSGEDRWSIPSTWAWRGLADLVLFVDYRGKTPTKQAKGVRLLTAKNVRRANVNLSPEEFISDNDYGKWMTRGFPQPGDVLFTTEAPMGNAAVVKLTERFALAQRVICLQSYGAIDTAFLVLQIISEQFQLILERNATGVTAKGIKGSKLKQLPIAVPPLAEQRRIVAKVEELMALVDQLESQLAASEETGTKLLDALVAELAPSN